MADHVAQTVEGLGAAGQILEVIFLQNLGEGGEARPERSGQEFGMFRFAVMARLSFILHLLACFVTVTGFVIPFKAPFCKGN